MAERLQIRKVTCPGNVLQAAAIETDLTFDPGIVVELEIVIPDGHAGVTGLALAQAHSIVIPDGDSDWIVGNDEVIRWPLDGFLNNGSWSAFTYNTDLISHSWYLRFLINENRASGTPAAFTPPAPADQILQAGGELLGPDQQAA